MPALLTLACAACGFGEDESRGAYIGTTALLSALPLALVFGFVFWLRRRAKQQAAQQPQLQP